MTNLYVRSPNLGLVGIFFDLVGLDILFPSHYILTVVLIYYYCTLLMSDTYEVKKCAKPVVVVSYICKYRMQEALYMTYDQKD